MLSHLTDLDKKTQNRLVYELSRGDVKFTVPILLHLMTEHVEIADELPIIKETLLSNLLAYPELLIEFLSDTSIKDKAHLINVSGGLRFEEAVPALLYLVANSQDEAEIKLIVETLGMIGDPQAINTLTDFMYAANRDLIITAIQALGQVGTPSAMHRLSERMGTDNEMDL